MPANNNYNKRFKPLARGLRNKSTKSEVRLWCEVLRNKSLLGFTFLRQRIVDPYIADFLCKDLMLIIELDGKSHESEEAVKKDEDKDIALQKLGFTVMRIRDEDVMNNLDNVTLSITAWIREHHPAKVPSSP
jgi:very-short-patch-repair endonuclease